jgi:hypothetical protein
MITVGRLDKNTLAIIVMMKYVRTDLIISVKIRSI